MKRWILALVALCSMPALAEADATEAEPLRVLVLELDSSGLPVEQVKVLNDVLGQSVSRVPNSKVTTTTDVKRMGDVEAKKQIMGCEDQSSCLADLAGDFGARYVVYGSVAELGDLFLLQLTLFDSETASAVKRTRQQSESLAAMASLMDLAVDDLFSIASPSSSSGIKPAYFVIGAGALSALVGGGTLVFGVLQAQGHQETQDEILSEQNIFESSEGAQKTEALSRAKDLQEQADSERGLANTAYG